jgi:hypothetical protein
MRVSEFAVRMPLSAAANGFDCKGIALIEQHSLFKICGISNFLAPQACT